MPTSVGPEVVHDVVHEIKRVKDNRHNCHHPGIHSSHCKAQQHKLRLCQLLTVTVLLV